MATWAGVRYRSPEWGRWWSQTGVGAYSYDRQRIHAVTQAGSDTFGYDANGNQDVRTVGGVASSLVWDHRNRLESVTTVGQQSQFAYDAEGSRVGRSEPDGTVTLFLGDLYEREVQSGATVAERSYYRFEGRLIAVRESSEIQWVCSDHLGRRRRRTCRASHRCSVGTCRLVRSVRTRVFRPRWASPVSVWTVRRA